MHSSLSLTLSGSVVVLLAAQASATPTLIYDSMGFESPDYTATANLTGQQSWQQFPLGPGGNSTADVDTTVVESGSQSLTINRSSLDALGATEWTQIIDPTNLENCVIIEMDMYIVPKTDSRLGPGFGLDIYDTAGNRLGGWLADTNVDPVMGGRLVTASETEVFDLAFDTGTWHTWTTFVDFSTNEISVVVDGVILSAEPFLGATNGVFSDAAILTSATDTNTTAAIEATGTAYVDNYMVLTDTVSVVPEPASALVITISGAALLRRRRRS